MFARRRKTRKLRQVARMLQAIDSASTRRTQPPRRSRAVVSRA
jgi:hypothetical protein